MRETPFKLPLFPGVDVAKLARVFDDTTQCYKYLFFRALLEQFNQTDSLAISLGEILAGMIEAAWWPVMHYRLTIGVGHGVHRMRELVESQSQDPDESFRLIDVRQYAACVAAENIDREISRGVLRYVPMRFLKPWLEEVTDRQIDAYVGRLLPADAEARGLPYRVIDRRFVELSAAWADYFRANMPILKAWADLHWLDWMQARNPNVAIGLEKLGPPLDRQSLARQTAFLRAALAAETAPKCIFTDQPLDPGRIALDHFIPRTYIGHDRIWNLVPITPEINSKKGARLPRVEAVDRLAAFHSQAIEFGRHGHIPNWTRFSDEYASDLRLSPDEIGDTARLVDAYRGTIIPMLTIAKRMGFPADWPPRT